MIDEIKTCQTFEDLLKLLDKKAVNGYVCIEGKVSYVPQLNFIISRFEKGINANMHPVLVQKCIEIKENKFNC